MITDITKSGYQKGYLPKTGVGVFHPFFATANVAFRRDALLETGGFDMHCATGEDVDLSIRLAKQGYELWFEPTARVTHYHRHTLRGLLKQWFGYGYGHAYLFKKHAPARRLQIYRYTTKITPENPYGIKTVWDTRAPFYGMVFFSSFHLMHLALVVLLLALISSLVWLALLSGALFLFTFVRYFTIRFDSRRPLKSLALAGVRYLADASYVLGGLLGGFRERVVYLEATRSRKRV